MLPRNHPDRIQITFDDRRLVANAGLLLPATLARHLGLPELVRQRLDLGDAPGRANTSDKMMTLVASALAGGDCIDDADVLRTGGTACTLGGTVKAPSTLGTFLRSFRWGHVRQLDRVSRELLARAWQAGAGPGDGPLTIDLDSTICETYGLAKEGARHHGYTGKRGYHPLLAVAAGTGDVLMSRLREGRANTARGAAHFLRETVGRVRYAGANGRLTLRADSGFYTHGVVSVCRKMDVRFSITIRQHKSLRNLIEAIPEEIGLMKQPTIKQVLLLFGLPVIGSVAGNVVYEHLITPAIPFLPRVPFILYSIFATAFAVLFLLGLIAATGQAFTKGWKLVTNNELRDDVRENIRRWPTSKWDLLPVIATTYFVATMLPMVALMVPTYGSAQMC